VRVDVTILPDGHVSRVKVLDATPYASLISEAASNCLFRPAKRRGKAVTVVVTIVFQFDTRK
jgi:TonB family protein